MKKYLKLVVFAAFGMFILFGLIQSRNAYKMNGLLGPREAYAQQPPGGGATGASQVPRVGNIVGRVTVAAGNTTVLDTRVGYPAVYTHCFASVHSPQPPVAGDQPGCVVTSTATVIASATATVGAINIQVAGTPSPSPAIDYLLTQ